ncbi:MAG: hypothetical protein OMM_00567 [Candidatus Magnetoglobus multicellularis str. Araruama]|uniref:DUF3786 domain-containing protein n=1 Tax=Candidatus Magnetoglobus multicellularis str. Araruama TaxID=890399 RepID=A0A1V1PGB8_9BACT|nr:MAG: hypothetical protein OMM_00567 [Candidatus Magnetoglobus multicellularis str. Araruama]
MTKYVDESYFHALSEHAPEDICARALCKYVDDRYIIGVWGIDYAVDPVAKTIEPINGNGYKPHAYFYLFIIYYLLYAKHIKIIDKWISEKDMPGGTTFFRGPHEIPTRLITDMCQNDIQLFKKACEDLNGTALKEADAAYRFSITPHIPVAVLYWIGDDDFPPEGKILYDKSITSHLTLDMVFSLAIEICTRICNGTK